MKCMLRLAPLAVDHANTALSAGAYDTVATVPRLCTLCSTLRSSIGNTCFEAQIESSFSSQDTSPTELLEE